MKLKTHIVLAFAFSILLLTTAASAQMVGGYKTMATTDAEAEAAANFAVAEKAKKDKLTISLMDIRQAEYQVVQGKNYRLCLKITTSGAPDEADVIITVRVIVYRDLKGKYSLSRWTEEDCGDEDED